MCLRPDACKNGIPVCQATTFLNDGISFVHRCARCPHVHVRNDHPVQRSFGDRTVFVEGAGGRCKLGGGGIESLKMIATDRLGVYMSGEKALHCGPPSRPPARSAPHPLAPHVLRPRVEYAHGERDSARYRYVNPSDYEAFDDFVDYGADDDGDEEWEFYRRAARARPGPGRRSYSEASPEVRALLALQILRQLERFGFTIDDSDDLDDFHAGAETEYVFARPMEEGSGIHIRVHTTIMNNFGGGAGDQLWTREGGGPLRVSAVYHTKRGTVEVRWTQAHC